MPAIVDIEEVIKLYNEGQRVFDDIEIGGVCKNKDLQNITFTNCFIAVSFIDTNLSNSTFKQGNIKTSVFKNTNLSYSTFENVSIEGVVFDRVILNGIQFKNNWCYGQLVDSFPDFLMH